MSGTVAGLGSRFRVLPLVSIVVPFFGLTSFMLRIPKGNPKRNYNGDFRQGLGGSWSSAGIQLSSLSWRCGFLKRRAQRTSII